MTQSTQTKQKVTTYLVYAIVALMFIDFLLIFLPFLEVRQPSYSETLLGVTTYKGWYTQSASMAEFIVPLVLPGIPYLCSLASFSASLRKKNGKSVFVKIKNGTLEKPIRFFWLKFSAIANVVIMWIFFSFTSSEVDYLVKHGAYCRITFFGVLNIVFTIILAILLFILSITTKAMVTSVNATQTDTEENSQLELIEETMEEKENEIKEIEE